VATLIDSLYVSLGLDPSDYKKGQKEAVDASKKTKEAAVRDAKAIEEAGKKAADGIKKIAVEALALFAIFTGSKSIGKFVTDLMGADAALGRFSRTIGLAPQYVAAIGKVVGEVGGTAEATAGTIDGLSSSLTRFRTANGDLPNEFWQLRAAVDGKIDPRGSMVDFLDQLAAALQKVEKADPQKASMYAKAMGIDQGTYQLMLKYGQELSKVIGLRKDLAPSQQDIENAQKFQEAWNNIFNAVQNLIEKGIRAIEPALTPIVKRMQEWVEANKAVISDKIVEYANSIASAFKSAADNISTVVSVLKALDDFNERSKKWEITKFLNGSAFNSNTPENSTQYGDPNGMFSASVRKGSIAESIINFFSGGGSQPSTGRASGGSVTGGQAYMVGERGPEPFIPNTTGTIIPHDKLGGDLSVDGRPINRANPMPVTLANSQGGGENWLQTLGRWLGFGGGGGSSGGGGGGGIIDTLFGGGKGSGKGGGKGGGGPSSAVDGGGKAITSKGGIVANQRAAYAALRAEGLSDQAARVFVANVSSEALVNPSDYHWDGKHYSQGIVQWDPTRSAAIKRQFGKEPRYLGVQDQMKAAVWEMKNNPAYRASWRAMTSQGLSDAQIMDTIVRNYERPAKPDKDVQYRLRLLRGLPGLADKLPPIGAKATAAATANVSNDNRSSTSSSSSTTNISKIEIHTQAKDANGIAASLHDSIRRNAAASAANNGPN
jgi:hypothetical protein